MTIPQREARSANRQPKQPSPGTNGKALALSTGITNPRTAGIGHAVFSTGLRWRST